MDEDAYADAGVMLGLLDEPIDESEEAAFDPFENRLGGKPVFPVPLASSLTDFVQRRAVCPLCNGILHFLLQIYAPLPHDDDDRFLWVFVCNSAACSRDARGWLVFRAHISVQTAAVKEQHAKVDLFAESEDACALLEKHLAITSHTCNALEALKISDKKTEKQKDARDEVNENKLGVIYAHPNTFSGFFLATAEEEAARIDEAAKNSVLAAFHDRISSEADAQLDAVFDEAAAAVAERTPPAFVAFQQRIAAHPTQILRYKVDGEPLRATEKHIAAPACEACGAPRRFEFQIVPTAIAVIDADAATDGMDWEGVHVFTCSADCRQTASDAAVECCIVE